MKSYQDYKENLDKLAEDLSYYLDIGTRGDFSTPNYIYNAQTKAREAIKSGKIPKGIRRKLSLEIFTLENLCEVAEDILKQTPDGDDWLEINK